MTAFSIDLSPVLTLTETQFIQLCAGNPDIKFERTATGELVIMSPTGGETGRKNAELNADFIIWNRKSRLGVVFDSSTCFRMSNFGGGDRSPDVSWIEKSRWTELSPEQRRTFPPIVPDFVLELLSPSDSLPITRQKMMEYMTTGVRLAWLINPENKTVEIYRQGQPLEVLEQPTSLSGESVLLEFQLDLEPLWD